MFRKWLRTEKGKKYYDFTIVGVFTFGLGCDFQSWLIGGEFFGMPGNLISWLAFMMWILRDDLLNKDDNMFDKRHDRFDKLAAKIGRKSLLFIRVWLIRLLPVCFLMQFLWGWFVRGSSWMVFMFAFFLSIIALVLIGSPKEKQVVWRKGS